MIRFRSGPFLPLVALAAACSGGSGAKSSPAVVLTACDPVAQTGCAAGKKCTWIRTSSSGTPAGALGCAPAGTAAAGAACSYGADGEQTGFDDCRGGLACLAPTNASAAQGTCEALCDVSNAGSCTPASSWACVAYTGYFANSGSAPTAGLCESQCNPLTQVRLSDGAAACGSPDPANPTKGCYGVPATAAGEPTVFTCALAGPANMTERVPVTGTVYLNSCAPGYEPLLDQSTGSTTPVCVAFCSPVDTTLQSHPSPGGASPYSCQEKGGSATDECRFLWWIEAPGATASAWSNGVGFCLDYPSYMYDSNNDGIPDTTFPSCTALSATAFNFDATQNDPTFWGCVAR